MQIRKNYLKKYTFIHIKHLTIHLITVIILLKFYLNNSSYILLFTIKFDSNSSNLLYLIAFINVYFSERKVVKNTQYCLRSGLAVICQSIL